MQIQIRISVLETMDAEEQKKKVARVVLLSCDAGASMKCTSMQLVGQTKAIFINMNSAVAKNK